MSRFSKKPVEIEAADRIDKLEDELALAKAEITALKGDQ